MKDANSLVRVYTLQISGGTGDGHWNATITAMDNSAAIAAAKRIVMRSRICAAAQTVYLWDANDKCISKWTVASGVTLRKVKHC
jgi:hypothetical protein